MKNKFKDLVVGDYIIIKDNSQYSNKILVIDKIEDNVAYAITIAIIKPYYVTEETYQYIAKIN